MEEIIFGLFLGSDFSHMLFTLGTIDRFLAKAEIH